VGMQRGTDTQTDVTNVRFALVVPHAKCNENPFTSQTDT